MKKLVIIAGITGSIGQELLRKYLVEENTLIYGISRKGISLSSFETLPEHHTILNVNLSKTKEIETFIHKIPQQEYSEIYYYHLVGEFKTEIDAEFNINIQNDHDNDGIDDDVYTLVTKAYKTIVSEILNSALVSSKKIHLISFGSLADKHEIECFSSFRKSRKEVEQFTQELSKKYKNVFTYLFSTSTILAADEMIERPYIFSTSVNPRYWITPQELVNKTLAFVERENKKNIINEDIFIAHPNFHQDYFCNKKTYLRRIKELYNQTIL